MYTKQALRELGVTPDTLTKAQTKQFDELGYFIAEGVLSSEDCEKMRSEFERIHAAESDKGGHEVHVEPGARRISNIFNKTDAFDKPLGRRSPRGVHPRFGRDQGPRRKHARSVKGTWQSGPAH